MKRLTLILSLVVLLLLVVPIAGAQEPLGTVPQPEAPTETGNQFNQLSFWIVSSLFTLFMAARISREVIQVAKGWIDSGINFVAGLLGREYTKGLFNGNVMRQVIIVLTLGIASYLWVNQENFDLFTTAPDVVRDSISAWWQNALTVLAFTTTTLIFHRGDYLGWLSFNDN